MPLTMSETKQQVQQLAADCALLPHIAVIAIEDNCRPGRLRAFVISRDYATAGALLTPSNWEEPPGGEYRYLSVPADKVGWQMTDILRQAGITDIIYRDETSEGSSPQ